MEEEEKIDYRLHLYRQIDNLVESGISVYDLDVVNKKAIKSNYILKSKIKEKIEELDGKSGGNTYHVQSILNAQKRILQELLEGK